MYKCPKCGAELQEGQEVCNCGTKITWQKPQEQSAQTTPSEMPIETPTEMHIENKIANILKVVGILSMFIGGILAVALILQAVNGAMIPNELFLIVLIVPIISGIIILGFADIIQCQSETIHLLHEIKDKLK